MWQRFAPFSVFPSVIAGAALALDGTGGAHEATAASGEIAPPPVPAGALVPLDNGETLPPNHPPIGASGNDETLPPNHPPIGSAASPHGARPTASDSPALVWKMPVGWQEAPNPSTLRLATYRVPGGVEVSVSRAGGAMEANIQRWIAQFDGVGREGRVERTVRGLHVVTVDVAGTYLGSGMAIGPAAEPKGGWALVGAIVESRSPSYFFKMTGPVAAVRAARPVFDRFIDGIAPM